MPRALMAAFALAGVLLALPGGARAAEGPQRLILTPEAGTIFRVEGAFPPNEGVCARKPRPPLRAKYRGTLELRLAEDDSVRLINSVTFGEYLRGLAEVPLSWPPAALRAQAIAARSYALHAYRRAGVPGRSRAYDICATDQCQVYRGAAVELGAFGERWIDAIDGTQGQVLTYRGNLIQPFYFSTSDGRTRRSFPGGTPQPWLPSVAGEDEDAPLARWTARVKLAHLTRVLRARGTWRGGTITSVLQRGDNVIVAGDETKKTISRKEIRNALNNLAPCLFLDVYPGRDGGAKLPQTIPSAVYQLTQSATTAVFKGRGWGHGVGMSQWGARSLAERGRSTAAILKHYYGPARVTEVPEPGAIRVLAAEDLVSVVLSAEGNFRVRTETGSVLAPGERFDVIGEKDGLRIARARGAGFAPVLQVSSATDRIELAYGTPSTDIAFEVSRPARVHIELTQSGRQVVATEQTSYDSGANAAVLTLIGTDRMPLAAGQYEVAIEAYDGLDHVRSRAVAMTIAAPPPPVPPNAPSRALPIGLAAGAILGVSGLLLLRRRQAGG